MTKQNDSTRSRRRASPRDAEKRLRHPGGYGARGARATGLLRPGEVSTGPAGLLQQRFHHDDSQIVGTADSAGRALDPRDTHVHQTERHALHRFSKIRLHDTAHFRVVREGARQAA